MSIVFEPDPDLEWQLDAEGLVVVFEPEGCGPDCDPADCDCGAAA